MDNGWGNGFFLACMFVLLFVLGGSAGDMGKEREIDRAIICMESTGDTKLCRIQAGLILEGSE